MLTFFLEKGATYLTNNKKGGEIGDRLAVSLATAKRLPSAKDSFLSLDARTSKAFSDRGLRVERLHTLAT